MGISIGLVALCWVLVATTAMANRELHPLLNPDRSPSETLLESLLYPGDFYHRWFSYVSEGDEAAFCLDSSLSAMDPFAQVYPERIQWPAVGGVDLKVEKLDRKLVPKDASVTDQLLDKGFAIRWYLRAVGHSFDSTPVFLMQAVGAEVISLVDGRTLMQWEQPAPPPICDSDTTPGQPSCRLRGISLETNAVAISPDGSRVAIAISGLNPRVEMYTISHTPARVWQALFPSDSGGVREVGFSGDGRFVTCLLGSGRTHRFDARTGGGHQVIRSMGTTVANVPPGDVVAVAGKTGQVLFWRLRDGTIDWQIPASRSHSKIDKMAVSGNGRRIVAMTYAHRRVVLSVWDIHRSRMRKQIVLNDAHFVDVALDGEGDWIYLTHMQTGVHRVSLNSGTSEKIPETEDCQSSLSFRPLTNQMVCSTPRELLNYHLDTHRISRLQTDLYAHTWYTDTAPGKDVTVAVGSGYLLVWR